VVHALYARRSRMLFKTLIESLSSRSPRNLNVFKSAACRFVINRKRIAIGSPRNSALSISSDLMTSNFREVVGKARTSNAWVSFAVGEEISTKTRRLGSSKTRRRVILDHLRHHASLAQCVPSPLQLPGYNLPQAPRIAFAAVLLLRGYPDRTRAENAASELPS
jgi:hypothetical protein